MKLAIVGSRNFNNYDLMTQKLKEMLEGWDEIEEIVSGGASGIDTLAKRYANEIGVPIKEFLPNWKEFGPAAGPIRNSQIVDYCTHLIAFPSKTGKGTQDSIRKAQVSQKIVKISYID